MKVCVPVTADQGLDSAVSLHFGSAPWFAMVDTETGVTRMVVNGDSDHAHGACQPLRALGGESVDAVVAGGIGAGAMARLRETGMKVYLTRPGTVRRALAALAAGELMEASPAEACAHHGEGDGCHGQAAPIQLS
ncbi:MAG: NifB/NifX family molybdenum-iron cluster-binding protein [Armatimonadetes bacterium]|nr:NifB/NifX family molybdenum-iron cluster-binding protein [Armatimonadota bacterium]